MTRRLLVIDDEPDIARYIGQVAEDLGYEVRVTTEAETFKARYDDFQPTAVILDIVMPDVDGIELIKFLGRRHCTARILVISGYHRRYLESAKTLGEALGLQSVTVMAKPVELPRLEAFLAGT